jgi:hypothetical protein
VGIYSCKQRATAYFPMMPISRSGFNTHTLTHAHTHIRTRTHTLYADYQWCVKYFQIYSCKQRATAYFPMMPISRSGFNTHTRTHAHKHTHTHTLYADWIFKVFTNKNVICMYICMLRVKDVQQLTLFQSHFTRF